MAAEYVFGYGSLVTLPGQRPARGFHPGGFVADLEGCTREWGTAMDNTRDLSGYKHYLGPDGSRPAVFVAFLDLRPDPSGQVNGVCAPVGPGAFSELDARERNYDRIDVTDRIAGARGRVWAYVGSSAGRARLATGRARGTAVIDSGYLGLVSEAFRRLGGDEYARCEPSLAPRGLPVRVLRRVDRPA